MHQAQEANVRNTIYYTDAACQMERKKDTVEYADPKLGTGRQPASLGGQVLHITVNVRVVLLTRKW